MKNYNVLFCDLDGTVIKTKSGATFPKGIWDMEFRFDVLDTIKKLAPDIVLIVSNQGGIESGFVVEDGFRAKLEYVCTSIYEYCNIVTMSQYCASNDDTDVNRKPNVGMLEYLTETYVGSDFDYIKTISLMVGDSSGKPGQWGDTDKKTAENFGIDYLDVEDFVKLYKD